MQSYTEQNCAPALTASDNVLPEHTLTCRESGPPAGSSVSTNDLSLSPPHPPFPRLQDESYSQQGAAAINIYIVNIASAATRWINVMLHVVLPICQGPANI